MVGRFTVVTPKLDVIGRRRRSGRLQGSGSWALPQLLGTNIHYLMVTKSNIPVDIFSL